jgi:hypothetical protein
MDVYFEIGQKKTIACALDWPGWCRTGRGEEAALETLLVYAARYASVLHGAGLDFASPSGPSAFRVVERLEGNATTDFGVPGLVPRADQQPVDDADLARFAALLQAYWRAFDAARSAAAGHALRKGPRGGGRELEAIVEHVVGAEAGYLAQLGWKTGKDGAQDPEARLSRTRAAVLEALPAAMRGELPARGPRGGLRWPPRYFVRRAGWHVLDHLWEIEDRIEA